MLSWITTAKSLKSTWPSEGQSLPLLTAFPLNGTGKLHRLYRCCPRHLHSCLHTQCSQMPRPVLSRALLLRAEVRECPRLKSRFPCSPTLSRRRIGRILRRKAYLEPV